jgi:predicted aminopeptidase
LRRSILSLLAVLALSGCETLSYYAQAVSGQLSLLSRKQTVEALLADPKTPTPLRERLVVAREIRDYAVKALKLPDNASYRSYAELDRPFAVWNVVAAPAFSLEPRQSCFPVAGCVAYRGFFSEADARVYADNLRKEGLDVYQYGVPAYSTLGKFDDPLLSTFIRFADDELARLVFHELTHQVAYVKDDSTFNESFAVTVERAGVRRWLADSGRTALMQDFLAREERRKEFAALMDQTRARLQLLYRQGIAPEAMREKKLEEMALLKEKLASGRFAAVEPNNAFLAAYATYTQLVATFEHLLAEEGGDLEKFYARVKQYAANEPSNRGPLSKPSR